MDIDDIISKYEKGESIALSIRKQEDSTESGNKIWTFYLKSYSKGKSEEYQITTNLKPLKMDKNPDTSKNYHKLLDIGVLLFPGKKNEFEFIEKNVKEQFELLMDYVGINGTTERPRSSKLMNIYKGLAKVASKLIEKGCTVTFLGDNEKAQKIASLYSEINRR